MVSAQPHYLLAGPESGVQNGNSTWRLDGEQLGLNQISMMVLADRTPQPVLPFL